MRFCVIGLRWGMNYVRNIESIGHTVSVICSRKSQLLPEAADGYNHVTDFKTVKLDQVDVVCVCTPPGTHFEIVSYFLSNAKHVIVEKPFVFSVEEAQALGQLALDMQVSLLISYQYLWNKDYLECIEPFRHEEGSISIENNSEGTMMRPDYSLLWDYCSHDLAMAYHMMDNKTQPEIVIVEQSEQGFQYKFICGRFTVSGRFVLNTNKKSRAMHVHAKELSGSFEDDYKFNSLGAMLEDFCNRVTRGDRVTNIDTAIAVTNTLVGFDARLSLLQGKK